MRKVVKVFAVIISIVILIPVILFIIGAYMYYSSDYLEPQVVVNPKEYPLITDGDSVRQCGKNTLIKNKYGLWEAKLYGTPIDRGVAYGVISKDLLEYQEKVFVDQIHEIIPSESWVEFLHKVIGVFNRNIASYVPSEYREEIYAMSLSGTNKYDNYGSSYIRQLNYHAAHDIGHALQEYMLVGCSSFATWDEMSDDSLLVVGRNFDFYVGDAFAKNKIVLFMEPQEGYRFASVTWPGMMGVLSGMNEKGLTVTINAAKGAIPTKSAMPISLLTRKILQYASNIEKAYEIAQQHETFVSESILIGSAEDHCAAIIEKTPAKTALYNATGSAIICTNHYQSDVFKNDKYNIENIANSDSPYRYERLNELIAEHSPIDTQDAVSILRNRHGAKGEDIGLTNEKSINQYIGHHSVVFLPEELKMWVSTSPWQVGAFICYDLNTVFSASPLSARSEVVEELVIPADSSALASDYPSVLKYKSQSVTIRNAIKNAQTLSDDYLTDFINNNHNLFQTYNTAGDYMLSIGNQQRAVELWKMALTKEIARKNEREDIENKIKEYE